MICLYAQFSLAIIQIQKKKVQQVDVNKISEANSETVEHCVENMMVKWCL